MEKMKMRDEIVMKCKNAAIEQLGEVSAHARYSELLTGLIAQGLLRLMEPKVVIQCRAEDAKLVKSAIAPAVALYSKTMKQRCAFGLHCLPLCIAPCTRCESFFDAELTLSFSSSSRLFPLWHRLPTQRRQGRHGRRLCRRAFAPRRPQQAEQGRRVVVRRPCSRQISWRGLFCFTFGFAIMSLTSTSTRRPAFTPPPSTSICGLVHAPNSAGGVVLLGLDNRIAVDNTLDSRVDLAFEQLKPKIRELLFGKRPAPVREPYKPAQHH